MHVKVRLTTEQSLPNAEKDNRCAIAAAIAQSIKRCLRRRGTITRKCVWLQAPRALRRAAASARKQNRGLTPGRRLKARSKHAEKFHGTKSCGQGQHEHQLHAA